MTPDQRIDKNIGDFLRDAGLLGHYRATPLALPHFLERPDEDEITENK